MPLPDGPLRISYAGCLSDHAVRSPALCATLKTVFTLRYECGYTRVHVTGSIGSASGLISVVGSPVSCRMLPGSPDNPAPASMLVESRSADSSKATFAPRG